MAKKQKPENPMEGYINDLINKKLSAWDSNLKKEDAAEIVKSIMPELEKIVSKVVLTHLTTLLKHSLGKLKEE